MRMMPKTAFTYVKNRICKGSLWGTRGRDSREGPGVGQHVAADATGFGADFTSALSCWHLSQLALPKKRECCSGFSVRDCLGFQLEKMLKTFVQPELEAWMFAPCFETMLWNLGKASQGSGRMIVQQLVNVFKVQVNGLQLPLRDTGDTFVHEASHSELKIERHRKR